MRSQGKELFPKSAVTKKLIQRIITTGVENFAGISKD